MDKTIIHRESTYWSCYTIRLIRKSIACNSIDIITIRYIIINLITVISDKEFHVIFDIDISTCEISSLMILIIVIDRDLVVLLNINHSFKV